MTPQEQQASDVMHRELGVKVCVPVVVNGKVHYAKDLSEFVTVSAHGPDTEVIRITNSLDDVTITLSQNEVRHLERFLVTLGWRCS